MEYYNKEIEEVIIGAALLEVNSQIILLEQVKSPDDFYYPKHQKVFAAMLYLNSHSDPIDMQTVTVYLREKKLLTEGLKAYDIAKLTEKANSGANIEYHIKLLLQWSIRRALKQSALNILKLAETEQDCFDAVDKAEIELLKANQKISSNNVKNTTQSGSELLESLQEDINNYKKGIILGLPTGFTQIDKRIKSYKPNDLIIIGARPGMGKTCFVMQLMLNASRMGKKILFFSLEMSTLQISKRFVSNIAAIENDLLFNPNVYTERILTSNIQNAVNEFSRLGIFIDDTSGISPQYIKSVSTKIKKIHNIDAVIIDYLQLMQNKGYNKEDEIAKISSSLKSLAKTLNVPVVVLSQLSRDVEKRGGEKIPNLSDLRYSGAIEQDADIIQFLYRPEYYGITENEQRDSLIGITDVITAKFRNGNPGTDHIYFNKEQLRFTDIDQDFGNKDFDLFNNNYYETN